MKKLAFFLCLIFGLAGAAPPKKAEAPLDTSPEHIAELIGKLNRQSVGASNAYKELVRIGPAALPQLVEAVESKKPWVRVWAGAALGASRDPRAVDPMLKLLQDPFFQARKIAAWHAAGLHRLDKRIAPAIVQRLTDSDEGVRGWAERALIKCIKFRGAVGELTKMTHGDSAMGRTAAFKLLMRHRKQDAAAAIAAALSEEKDWHVRSAAVRCLGEGVLKPHQPFFDLLYRAMTDESEEVKADAVEVMEHALKETADRMPENIRAPITKKLGEKLPPFLDAKLPRLRGASLYLLAAGRGSKLLERALKAMDDPSPVVRVYAIRALGRCGVKTWPVVDKAFARLNDDHIEVRRLAIKLLSWATRARFEYKPGDSAEKRAQAVKQIKARLDKARPR